MKTVGRVVGVVPAAGRARRLGTPEASKELSPVYTPRAGDRPLPVCYRLLHALAEADVAEAVVVTRSAKSDLRERLGGGDGTTPRLAHLEVLDSPSAAYTVAQGTRWAGDATIALGFPDVLWDGPNAFRRLLALIEAGADVALGVFPPAPDYTTHGVEIDPRGRVRALLPPTEGSRSPAWTLAAWRPVFSRVLESAVAERYEMGGFHEMDRPPPEPHDELDLTAVMAAAMADGLDVRAETLSERPFVDVGEPARLRSAVRRAERDL